MLEVLRNSERARMVFAHLKELMDKKPGVISVSEWKNQFENIEVAKNPFDLLRLKYLASLLESVPRECELAALQRQLPAVSGVHLRTVDDVPRDNCAIVYGVDQK